MKKNKVITGKNLYNGIRILIQHIHFMSFHPLLSPDQFTIFDNSPCFPWGNNYLQNRGVDWMHSYVSTTNQEKSIIKIWKYWGRFVRLLTFMLTTDTRVAQLKQKSLTSKKKYFYSTRSLSRKFLKIIILLKILWLT